MFFQTKNVYRMLHKTGANYTGEWTFLVLKRIKNYLRSSMSMDRINVLVLLIIGNELLNTKDFNDLINEFTSKKVRKKMFRKNDLI